MENNKIPVPDWERRVNLDIAVGLAGGIENLKCDKIILEKIISGGQTGADRASLEAAKELGLETGGYAPKDFKTENGSDYSLKDFGLVETSSKDYNMRTILNITNSDGTVIFGLLDSPGSKLALKIIKQANKPLLTNPRSVQEFQDWLITNKIKILNCAGNRESIRPGIFGRVKSFLIESLKSERKEIKNGIK